MTLMQDRAGADEGVGGVAPVPPAASPDPAALPSPLARRSLIVPATAGSVLLAMLALTQVFQHQPWLIPAAVAVAIAFGVGWAARRLDVPALLAPALSVLALVTFVGLLFHRDTTAYGLPTPATLRAIGESLAQAGRDIREQSTPADPTDALTLLAVSGVFAIATMVDLIALRLRRPVLAGMPLLALFLVPTAVASRASAWAFVLAAIGYLGVLVAEGRDRARGWGRRLSGIAALDGVADVSHVARVGRRIGGAAIGTALCAALILPSVGEGIFDGSGLGPFGKKGGSSSATTINPLVEIRGQLIDTHERELLRVRTDRAEYLRLTTLNVFNGNEWMLVPLDEEADHKVGGKRRVPTPLGLDGVATEEISYDLDIGSLQERWLPLAYAPWRVEAPGDWRWESSGLAVFSTTRRSGGASVHAVSRVPRPTIEQLRAEGEIPASIRPYLDVPAITPKIAEQVLAEQTTGLTNPYDKAVALNEYFYSRGGFVYDLNVPQGTAEDALESFLIKKHGYCEQFAATMAYLARLGGIPARVVVGFTPGHVGDDGRYVVTNRDAHAWPELYFPHAGWVRFEPTARTGATRPDYAVPGPAVQPTTQPQPSARPSGPTPTATPPGGRGKEAADEANEDGTNPGATARGVAARVPYLPLGVAVALALLATPFVVGALTTRRRNRRASDHVDRIHAAWAALTDAAEDAGHPLHAADSPRGAARRLVADVPLVGPAAEEVARIATAEERARYARSVAPVDGLDASVRAVRRSLRGALRPLPRARSVAFPPSALRRMRASVRSLVARGTALRLAARRRAAGLVPALLGRRATAR